MKPYSVTPLYFRSKRRIETGYVLDPIYPCRVKIRFLEEKYVRDVIEYFSKKNTLTITDMTFQIASIAINTRDYAELEEYVPVEAFRLEFETPTYLVSLGAGFYHVFPDPLKIFPNLMRSGASTQPHALPSIHLFCL